MDRFWSKVEKTDTCWLWTASTGSHGYGQISVDRRPRLAHRMAYELLVGPIPAGMVIDHLCRTRRCVNPEHMEVTTHRVNILRGVGMSARHAGKTHCVHGHAYTDENTYTRPRGSRECRTCMRAREARRAAA